MCDAHKGDDNPVASGCYRPYSNVLVAWRPSSGPGQHREMLRGQHPGEGRGGQPGQGRVLVVDGGGSLRRALVERQPAASAAPRNSWSRYRGQRLRARRGQLNAEQVAYARWR